MTTTAAAAGTHRYAGIYPADPAQVRHARAALAELLRGYGKPLTGPDLERFPPWRAAPEDPRAWAQPPPPG